MLLPLPAGPSRATNSPGHRLKSTPRSPQKRCPPRTNSLLTPRASIMAGGVEPRPANQQGEAASEGCKDVGAIIEGLGRNQQLDSRPQDAPQGQAPVRIRISGVKNCKAASTDKTRAAALSGASFDPQVLEGSRSFQQQAAERSTEVGAEGPAADFRPAPKTPGWLLPVAAIGALSAQAGSGPQAEQRRLQSSVELLKTPRLPWCLT